MNIKTIASLPDGSSIKETDTTVVVAKGYIYAEDGTYLEYKDGSDNVFVAKSYAVKKIEEDSEKKSGSKITYEYHTDPEDLEITHVDFRKKAATVYGESSAYRYNSITDEIHDEIFAIAEVFKINTIAYGSFSNQAKRYLAKTAEENNKNSFRKAANASIIYTQQNDNPTQYSNNATNWDGKEQALYDTDDRSQGGYELHMNTWGWKISDEHYHKWKENIGERIIKAPQTKKATTGGNKGKICAKSTAVYGETIFWKVKSGGYSEEELK